MVYQASLELVGDGVPVIDNIDAFKSTGSFGAYDLDDNGQLDGQRIWACRPAIESTR